MNLTRLFEIQAGLDEHIMEEHPELKGQDNLDWKILALQVELGECANEWRGFKKWSYDQEPRNYEKCHVCNGHGETMVPSFPTFDEFEQELCPVCQGEGLSGKNPLLEEYVDGLHFCLSLGLEIDFDVDIWDLEGEKHHTIIEQFLALNANLVEFHVRPFEMRYVDMLQCYLGLGEMLGFSWKQIEQAYLEKNKVNHERQNEGY